MIVILVAILFISALICLGAFALTYRPTAKFSNGMLFAVTLPAHAMESDRIRRIQKQFNKRFRSVNIGMALALIPLFLLSSWPGYAMLYFLLWMMIFISLSTISFRSAFRDTLALKREQEWYVGAKRVIQADLRVAQAKNRRTASMWLFVIPFMMSIGIMLWSMSEDSQLQGLLTIMAPLITIVYLLVSLMSRRVKAKVYSMNSEVNLALNQASRRAKSYMWLWLAIVENAHVVLFYLFLLNKESVRNEIWLELLLLFTIIPTGIVFFVYRYIRKLEQELLEQDGKVIYSDDDEYWGNGFTYHNPNDKSLFVTKRVGMGETINTGTLAGKVIASSIITIIAAVIIGTAFMLIRSELSSPTLTIASDQQVHIEYPMYSFDFNLTEIEQLDLVDQIPTGMRINGEGTKDHLRGQFRLQDLGKSRLYVYKNQPPYIKIKLKETYIFFNEKEPRATKQLFEQLKKEANK